MVDLWLLFRVRDECKSDKSMDREICRLIIFAQMHNIVVSFPTCWCKNFAWVYPAPQTTMLISRFYTMVETSYPPKVGDLVAALVAHHGPPFLLDLFHG